jgi:UbiD family decarboxylase
MPNDLRNWIKIVEEMGPGELIRITKPVKPHEFEVIGILRKLQDEGKFPAVLFENPLNLDNEPSGMQFLTGCTTHRARVTKTLGIDPKSPPSVLFEEMAKRNTNPIKYEKIPKKDAPVKEVVWTGDKVNLRKLPMAYNSEMDGNTYFDMNPISIDPDTGRYNISWQRMMYKGPKKTGIFIVPRHLEYNRMQWAKKGKDCPMVYLLGHNPLVACSASVEVGFEVDEYELAGAWLGEPLRVTPSETWGDDFLVPADAEIVLEGYIPWGKRETEGPFGEFTGYYGPQRLNPYFELTAITFRKNPIVMHCFMWYESNTYAIGNEATMYLAAKRRVPGVMAVNNMYNFNCIVQMKKLTDGDPKRAALAVLGSDIRLKHVIVVDEDVNPFNISEVMWAIGSRVQSTKDVECLSGVRGTGLDPSMVEQNVCDVMIIDATRPVEQPFEFRVDVPKEVKEKIKLEDYIPKKVLDQIPFLGFAPYIMP